LALSNTKSTGQEGSKADDFPEKVPQGIKGVTKANVILATKIYKSSNTCIISRQHLICW